MKRQKKNLLRLTYALPDQLLDEEDAGEVSVCLEGIEEGLNLIAESPDELYNDIAALVSRFCKELNLSDFSQIWSFSSSTASR